MSTLIDATAAAEKLGVSRHGLYKAVARQTHPAIPHVHVGKSLRFDPVDLDRYIALLKARSSRCTTCGQRLRVLKKVS